jgi:signal transduction histidine kinase
VALVLASDHYEDRIAWAVLLPVLGGSFIGTGLFAWLRRPDSRVGLLMMLVGFAWFLKALKASDSSLLYTLGFPLGSLYAAAFIHLLLSFPSGRLGSRVQRTVVAGGYAFLAVATVPLLLVTEAGDTRLGCEHDCPRNLLLIEPNDALADVYVAIVGVAGVGLLGAVCVLSVMRWRRASVPERRILAPVLATGCLAAACFAIAAATGSAALNWIAWGWLVALPFAFLAGVLRARLARSAVADLMIELRANPAPDALRDSLARALGDPSLALAFWLPEYGSYADLDGSPVELVDANGDRTTTLIERDGRPVAALLHHSSLHDEPGRLDAVAAAAAMALENVRLNVELRARLDELKGSRARIVEAGDSERRRLERNLHDGAQQRMVAIALQLRLLKGQVRGDPEMAEQLLTAASEELALSLKELRDLARGLHPAVLEQGLPAALDSLANRSTVPTTVTFEASERLPERVELAAYFVASEALTNVVKYAQATAVTVRVWLAGRVARIEIADDGIGGADDTNGSGLRGLADRVEALDGRLLVSSPPGGGTVVTAEMPCGL